jgi:PAS domain S-box-containing protein
MSVSGDVVPFILPTGSSNFEELEDFFENGAIGLHLVGPDGTILRANKAELAMMGVSAEEYIGRNISDFHADQAVLADILKRLKAGEKLDKYPARLRSKDGSIREVLITSSGRFRNGEFLNTRCFTIDITEAKKAQDELAERESHFRQLLDALPAAIYTTDAKGIITYFNRAAVEFSGRVPDIGRDHWCVTWRLYSLDGTPLPHDQCPMAIALRERRPVRGVEAIAERPDGSRVPFTPYPTPLTGRNGELTGAVNMLVDMTAQKEAAQRQHLLIRELHHRVKNTLATVQAIMGTTMRFSTSMEDFQNAFIGRIAALSKTHSLLTEDTDQLISFRLLLKNELDPFDDGSGRVRMEGRDVMLPAHLAVPVGMAIHELTTNAVKHGALSVVGGTVLAEWHEQAGRLMFNWRENNVPDVRPPQHKGFGSQLLSKVLPQQIEAEVAIDFAASGVNAAFSIPLAPPDAVRR